MNLPPKVFTRFATFAVVLLSLARFTPEVWPGRPYPPQWFGGARVAALLAQKADPVRWDRTAEFIMSGGGALKWRLLPAVVGHDLDLTATQYLFLPWLGALWVLALAGKYALDLGGTPGQAAATVALVATSSCWFVPTGWLGQFDPFYLVALLAVAFSPSTVAVCAAGLLGPWVDERFLLMLPAVACLRWRLRPSRRWVQVLALAVAPYLLVRLAALLAGDTSVSGQFALQGPVFLRWLPWVPFGWAHGWRLGWLPIATCLAGLFQDAPPAWRWTLAASLAAGLGAVAFLAFDVSRSIAVMVPFLVLGTTQWRDTVVLWMAVALNFVLPAYQVSALVTGSSATPAIMPITSWLLR
jgi:hypothetical protein